MAALPRVAAAIVALALGLGGALVVAAPASAATLTVTNPVDDGNPGSLTWALLNYTAGDTIDITTAGPVVADASGLPTIFDDVTITGPSAGVQIIMDAGGGSFTIDGATVTMSNLDVVSDTAASGQGITVIDGSLTLTNVSVRDFDWGIFYVDTVGGNALNLTDVDAGGTLADPSTIGISVQTLSGAISLTRVAVDYTAGAGVLVGTGGGTVALNTVSAADGSGILVQATDTTVQANQLTTARTVDGITFYLDNSGLTLTDVQVTATEDVGLGVIAENGSTVTARTLRVSTSDDSGIVFDATDSTIEASDVESYENGQVPGCGCGGAGSGIELYADDSTVTLSDADSHDNDAEFGGGIYIGGIVSGSPVSISNVTVTGNDASDDGGGIYLEGFSDDDSSLTIADSTVSGNTAGDFGAGIYLNTPGAGATSTAFVHIVRTTVDGNTGNGYGAGIAIADPAPETNGEPTVLVENSTVSNNTTPAGGGGFYISKGNGGLAVVQLLNSTVTANHAQAGGAAYIEGNGALSVLLTRSTLADNIAHTSGGIEDNNPATDLEIENSILSGSTSDNGSTPDDLSTSNPVTVSYSIVQTPQAGVVVAGPGVVTGVAPQLAALANNGGSTRTMLVTPASPAWNAGNPAFVGAGLFDQRGQARVYQVLDMGAVEWHPALADTGVSLEPEPPLVALLLLFAGIAMVAFSRLQGLRSIH